jgi:D-alanyl-D-alanine-carboxypeptidase/D-alanyl-D-alanine-endopeptidase
MYSTASDMTRWLEYLLGLPGVPMHQDPAATATYIPASQLRWTQGMGRAGVPDGIGLGWVHITQPDHASTIIEKTGGGAGYNTYIALIPARRIGLFVAATNGRHAGTDIFHVSNDLLTYLAGLAPPPGEQLELAAQANHPDVPATAATVHKHRKHAERPGLSKQPTRTNSVAAGQ